MDFLYPLTRKFYGESGQKSIDTVVFFDSKYLQDTAARLNSGLRREGFIWENVLADAGYSSGENYAYFENKSLTTYIPPHGIYKGGPEGFEYIKEGNYWLCPQGKLVTFRNQKMENGNYFRSL